MKQANRKHLAKSGVVAATVGAALALTLGSTPAFAQSSSPATPSTERMDDTNIYSGNRMAGGTTASPTALPQERTKSGSDKAVKWNEKDTKPRSERLDNSSVYNPTPAGESGGARTNSSAR